MGFTDNCDVFASFHEDGFNRVVEHVRRQRPSLFNYATATLANDPALLCHRIVAHPIISIRGNPLVTLADLLPVPGTEFGLDFCVQVTKLAVDFHPGNAIGLPPELAPLAQQRLALEVELCAGIACPGDILDQFVPPPATKPPRTKAGDQESERDRENERGRDKPPLRPLPFRKLNCFCLKAFATAGVRIKDYAGKPYVEPFLVGFEIVDITPKALESSIECYVATILRLSVLPGLRVLLENEPLDIIKDKVKLSLLPMPTSAALPNNPAIEDDQLKAFVKVKVN
jgi:hypothetical protein